MQTHFGGFALRHAQQRKRTTTSRVAWFVVGDEEVIDRSSAKAWLCRASDNRDLQSWVVISPGGLKNTSEEDTGEDTTLKKPNIKLKGRSTPLFCLDTNVEFVVVVKKKVGKRFRYVIPMERKLYEVVFYRTIGITKIKPSYNNLSLFMFGVQQCLEHCKRVF